MRYVYILLFLVGYSLSFAQKTQTEVLRAVNSEQDSKLNSPEVPEVMVQSGTFEKVLVFRFKHNTDLLEGLEKTIEREKIKNAVILSGIGSVRGYHCHVVSNRDFPSKNLYIKDPTQPADICNMNGYIIDGRLHPHITFANDEKAFGGHLELGTHVFTFAIVTVGVLSDNIDLSRADDKTLR